MKYIEPLARLIAQLSKLPSVGEKPRRVMRTQFSILPKRKSMSLSTQYAKLSKTCIFAKFAAITPKTRFVIFAKLANQA